MGWISDLFKELPLSVNLQAKLETLEEKFAVLEAENKNLKSENENLRQEIQRRDDIIQKYESHKNLLDDTKLEILKLLYKQPKLQTEQIAQAVGIQQQLAEFHLKELRKTKYIRDSYPMTKYINQVITEWSLDQEGTRYLLDNKLA